MDDNNARKRRRSQQTTSLPPITHLYLPGAPPPSAVAGSSSSAVGSGGGGGNGGSTTIVGNVTTHTTTTASDVPAYASGGAAYPPFPSHLAMGDPHAHHPGPTYAISHHQRDLSGGDMYALAESEGDDADQHGPPKKKRRRQALSCTECKRRKIKCDRNHPCTPCKRRGEESACQWHSIEPVEKYTTKVEFEHLRNEVTVLRDRCERLENVVRSLMSGGGGGVGGSVPSAIPSGLPSNPPLQPPSTTSTSTPHMIGSTHYYSAHDSPAPSYAAIAEGASHHHRTSSGSGGYPYVKTEGAGMRSPTMASRMRMGGGSGGEMSPSMGHMGVGGGSGSGIHAGGGMAGMGGGMGMGIGGGMGTMGMSTGVGGGVAASSGGSALKSSPLALSSITSPYHPDASASTPLPPPQLGAQSQPHSLTASGLPGQPQQQSKNCHAQMLILGERLRRAVVRGEGPVSFIAAVVVVVQLVVVVLLRLAEPVQLVVVEGTAEEVMEEVMAVAEETGMGEAGERIPQARPKTLNQGTTPTKALSTVLNRRAERRRATMTVIVIVTTRGIGREIARGRGSA
ncbi:hypothetical protein BDN70DRAFT_616220 [Pholiota conissans]|uniref:Zn(2)-C6 fungal-type domain-containing protein n=1 Tax=Pholiota conissans TaxID=109636 RepID=A0A9P5Z2S8_9AGAR|nr:hypothetical protein BDN70DRAFT_616220 [Pholiota conissans]